MKNKVFFNDSKLIKMALLRGITSKNHGGFYCLNCLDSFAAEKKNLKCIKKYVKINIFVM